MKIKVIALIILICVVQNAQADEFFKKFEFPIQARIADDDFGYYKDKMDFFGDGMQKLVLVDENYSSFKALDPEENYEEFWSYTPNPASICTECTHLFFRFSGFCSIYSLGSHVVIGYEYYDNTDVQIFGVLLVRLSDNYVEWKMEDCRFRGSLERNSGLDDLVFTNTITWGTEVWGWGIPISGVPPQSVPALRLDQNRPNPFNPTTVISFSTDTSAPTSLDIHDLGGRLVFSRDLGTLNHGEHEFAWRGRDNTGRQIAAGTYFYTVTTGGQRQSRKMLLLK